MVEIVAVAVTGVEVAPLIATAEVADAATAFVARPPKTIDIAVVDSDTTIGALDAPIALIRCVRG